MPNKEFVPHLVHSHDVQIDADYAQWLVELKERYRSAQIKAAVKRLVQYSHNMWEKFLTFEGVTTPLGVSTYNGIKVSDVLPSEEVLRQRVHQLENELRISRRLIHKLTD